MYKSILLIICVAFFVSACNLNQSTAIPDEVSIHPPSAPQVPVVQTITVPCEFSPFGIGGDVEVYSSPNLNTEPIHFIQVGATYPVIDVAIQADNNSNRFYQLSFGDFTGWVLAIRGELIGNCEMYR